MSRKQKNRVGVIGLGQIGSKVSAGLRSAGFSVYVWNRSPRAEPNFLGSAVEVVDLCDTIQLFIPDDAALDKVIRTITAALRPRHVILAHPTISPTTAIELGAIVESTGARYVDAPFAGGRAEAGNRQLVYYVGGSEAAIKEAQPVLQATARSIVPVGGIGDAARLKLSLQILTALTLEGLSEMLALARAGGLRPEALLDALEEDPNRSAFISEKLTAMVKGNFEGGSPVRHLYRDLQLALKLAGPNPAVPATGTVAGLLFGAMKRGWATSDAAIISQSFEPDPPPVEIATTEPVAAESSPAIDPLAPDPTDAPTLEPVASELVAVKADPIEVPIDAPVTATKTPVAPAPMVRVPPELSDAPARSGMIPETYGGRGAVKPRRGLELLHTTPVRVGPPKPATAPVRLPAITPTTTARPATASAPPIRPPTTIIPSNLPVRPATTRIPPPAPVRSTHSAVVPLPPFPAAPPVSPNFPVGTSHRIVRRLSDTTTNLQALLQSPLSGTQPVPVPSKLSPGDVTPVLPNPIGPNSPASSASPGAEGVVRVASDEVFEAIVSEILPPAIDPVIPGDIRPTQRVGLRPVAGADNAVRPRLIREQKPKGWLKRLIGD